MLILHLSDIHFKSGVSDKETDPDLPYRTKILRDVQTKRTALGNIDRIIVGGDIAYAGKADEYEMAGKWLQDLRVAGGCNEGGIYVVPGNHDIDRSIIGKDVSVLNAQNAVINAVDKEAEFRRQIKPETLFKPLAAYNEFAAKYDCQLDSDRIFWKHAIPISTEVTLNLFGLTSTFLSGRRLTITDIEKDLYLSPLQTVLNERPGTINGVLCHHPPDWLHDNDDVDSKFCNRAKVHFLGHKHKQRITRERDYLRIAAAAVNPDRREAEWEPGYNLLKISATRIENDLHLDFHCHIRVWQKEPEGFVPKKDGDDDVFEHQIKIKNFSFLESNKTVAAEPASESALIDSMDKLENRSWISRFWNLPSSDRREIAEELGLLKEGEMTLPESTRYGRALHRAAEAGKFAELKEQISKREQ